MYSNWEANQDGSNDWSTIRLGDFVKKGTGVHQYRVEMTGGYHVMFGIVRKCFDIWHDHCDGEFCVYMDDNTYISRRDDASNWSGDYMNEDVYREDGSHWKRVPTSSNGRINVEGKVKYIEWTLDTDNGVMEMAFEFWSDNADNSPGGSDWPKY